MGARGALPPGGSLPPPSSKEAWSYPAARRTLKLKVCKLAERRSNLVITKE